MGQAWWCHSRTQRGHTQDSQVLCEQCPQHSHHSHRLEGLERWPLVPSESPLDGSGSLSGASAQRSIRCLGQTVSSNKLPGWRMCPQGEFLPLVRVLDYAPRVCLACRTGEVKSLKQGGPLTSPGMTSWFCHSSSRPQSQSISPRQQHLSPGKVIHLDKEQHLLQEGSQGISQVSQLPGQGRRSLFP